MHAFTLDETASDLSRLVKRAAEGEPFIITESGKPLVKVVPVGPSDETANPRRLGFLTGQIEAPDDLDRMGADDIERLFGGGA